MREGAAAYCRAPWRAWPSRGSYEAEDGPAVGHAEQFPYPRGSQGEFSGKDRYGQAGFTGCEVERLPRSTGCSPGYPLIGSGLNPGRPCRTRSLW